MKRAFVYSILVVLILFCSQLSFAQSSGELKALKDEVKTLKEGPTANQKDIQEIKSLPIAEQAKPEPQFKEAVIRIKGAPLKGDDNAKIVILVFSDFRCVWCGGFVRETLPQIEDKYIKTGKVKYVFFDYPLNSTSSEVAENAKCAGEQDKFWEMHDWLFSNQGATVPADLIDHAEAIGLDIPKFKECIERHKYAARIVEERGQGSYLGVNGVPTFFLGFAELEDKVRVLKVLYGFKGGSYEAFKEAIEELLSSQKK